jgi:hypothetical protein
MLKQNLLDETGQNLWISERFSGCGDLRRTQQIIHIQTSSWAWRADRCGLHLAWVSGTHHAQPNSANELLRRSPMNLFTKIAMTASLVTLSASLAVAAQNQASGSTLETDDIGQPIDKGGIEINPPSIAIADEETTADKAAKGGDGFSLAESLETDVEAVATEKISLEVVPFAPAMLGDLNGDLIVNTDDLLLVVNNWGPCVGETRSPSFADVAPEGGDCNVDIDDMLVVLMNWGA